MANSWSYRAFLALVFFLSEHGRKKSQIEYQNFLLVPQKSRQTVVNYEILHMKNQTISPSEMQIRTFFCCCFIFHELIFNQELKTFRFPKKSKLWGPHLQFPDRRWSRSKIVVSPEISSGDRENHFGDIWNFCDFGSDIGSREKSCVWKMLIGDSSNKCCWFRNNAHQECSVFQKISGQRF